MNWLSQIFIEITLVATGLLVTVGLIPQTEDHVVPAPVTIEIPHTTDYGAVEQVQSSTTEPVFIEPTAYAPPVIVVPVFIPQPTPQPTVEAVPVIEPTVEPIKIPECNITATTVEWEEGGVRTNYATETATPYKARLTWSFSEWLTEPQVVSVKYPGTTKMIEVDGVPQNAQIADNVFPTASTLVSTTTAVVPHSRIYGLEFGNGTSCYTKTL